MKVLKVLFVTIKSKKRCYVDLTSLCLAKFNSFSNFFSYFSRGIFLFFWELISNFKSENEMNHNFFFLKYFDRYQIDIINLPFHSRLFPYYSSTSIIIENFIQKTLASFNMTIWSLNMIPLPISSHFRLHSSTAALKSTIYIFILVLKNSGYNVFFFNIQHQLKIPVGNKKCNEVDI